MALKVFKKGNVLAAIDTLTGETARINGTFAWYSIDEINNSISIGELTNQHKTISALAANVQDEDGTPIGDLVAIDTYLSEATNFKAASGGSGASRLFSQTADGVLISDTTEQSLIGSGEGSLRIEANSLKVGDSFKVKVGGILNSSTTAIADIYVRINSLNLFVVQSLSLDESLGNGFDITSVFTVRDIGSGGVLFSINSFTYSKTEVTASDTTILGKILSDSAAIDTTISNDLDVFFRFSKKSKNDSIQSTYCVFQKT